MLPLGTVALAVCQAAMGVASDRQFLGLVERQNNRSLRELIELFSTQRILALTLGML